MKLYLARSSIVLLVIFFLGAQAILPEFSVPVEGNSKADSVSLRLPNDTRPIVYDINIETRVDRGDFNFFGRVVISLEVINQTSEIVLHARQLTIQSISLRTASPVPEVFAVTYTYDEVTEFLTTKTDKILVQGNYILTIEYVGELRRDNYGFYLSTYADDNNNIFNLATTHFEPTDARHAFPCYDEPAKKAIFRITIKHGSSYFALSNMPVLRGPIDNGDGTVTTAFQQTTLTSTYLIAFIISNFEYTELQGKIPHRIYSRIGTKMDQRFALTTSVKTLEAFEDYLGVKYTLGKMDNVAVPDFAPGAMENWGLVTYREEVLLFSDSQSTTLSQNYIAGVISHEFAHQWFGNLVSPYWWTFAWLNEGFSAMLAFIANDAVFPDWDIWQRFHADIYQWALKLDGKANSRPMTHYAESPSEISAVFDEIITAKAASVLNMFRHVVTDDVFRKALSYYLKDMEYSAAQEDDFFRNFEKATVELKSFGNVTVDVFQQFKSWTNQGGYPLLTVMRDYNQDTFVIKQSPFDGTNDISSNDKRSWWVPFNFATAKNPLYTDTTMYDFLNIGEESKEISSNNAISWSNEDWIILNKKSTGYYRVNYDLENWKLLTASLLHDPFQFHVNNRAQLMDDAYAFVLSKHLKLTTFLDLSVYLKKENELAPWSRAYGLLYKINQYLTEDPDFGLFQYYVRKIVENFYNTVGLTEKEDDGHLTKIIRNIAISLACQANFEDCLMETRNRLVAFIETGKSIEPNIKFNVFCFGLTTAGETEYKFMVKLLMDSREQAFRRLLMVNVMGCIQNKTLLEQYLQSSILFDDSNNYKDLERINILPGVVSMGPLQIEAGIDFLMANHEEYSKLLTYYGVTPLMSAMMSIADGIVSHKQNLKFEELLSVLNGYSEIQGAKETLRATVKSNLDWISEYRNELIDWLMQFKEKEEGSGNGANTMVVSTSALLLVIVVSQKFYL